MSERCLTQLVAWNESRSIAAKSINLFETLKEIESEDYESDSEDVQDPYAMIKSNEEYWPYYSIDDFTSILTGVVNGVTDDSPTDVLSQIIFERMKVDPGVEIENVTSHSFKTEVESSSDVSDSPTEETQRVVEVDDDGNCVSLEGYILEESDGESHLFSTDGEKIPIHSEVTQEYVDIATTIIGYYVDSELSKPSAAFHQFSIEMPSLTDVMVKVRNMGQMNRIEMVAELSEWLVTYDESETRYRPMGMTT